MFVLLTFGWGFYLLSSYGEDDYFESYAETSVTNFLFRDVAAPDLQRLYQTVPPAVVGIGSGTINQSITASGALVGSGGYVVTALHAVQDVENLRVYVRTPSGPKQYDAQVVKSEATHDIALLKLLTNDKFMFFELSNTQQQVPVNVYAFGHGGSGSAIVKAGTVLARHEAVTVGKAGISHLIRTDAVYSWEQTGGPLVDSSGKLIGINVALQDGTGNLVGYAVPAHVLAAHFQDVVPFKIDGKVAHLAPAPEAAPAAFPGTKAMAKNVAVPPTSELGTSGASAWWAQARALVGSEQGAPKAFNIAMGQPQAPPAAPQEMPPTVAPSPIMDPHQVHFPDILLDTDHLLSGRVAGLPLADIAGLTLLSIISGILGGMMTMGGGVLQVAGMMVFFGYGMYLIRPVAYLTNIFVYGAASYRNSKTDLVMWAKVRALTPWAVIGVASGYFIGNWAGDSVVKLLLGGFALLMTAKALQELLVDHADQIVLRRRAKKGKTHLDDEDMDMMFGEQAEQEKQERKLSVWLSVALGLPMGLISGILGISGGVVEVPLQRYLGRVALQNAIANASVLVFWASISGAAVAFTHGISTGLIDWNAPFTLAAVMIPGAFIGGWIGAKLMRKLPVVVLKGGYALVMLAIAVKLLFLN
ncbi:Magnetosome protein MamO [Magnetospira sp. QH-2]|nr:Magnetosome protein MamO [Magnetospira sp. QH-2]